MGTLQREPCTGTLHGDLATRTLQQGPCTGTPHEDFPTASRTGDFAPGTLHQGSRTTTLHQGLCTGTLRQGLCAGVPRTGTSQRGLAPGSHAGTSHQDVAPQGDAAARARAGRVAQGRGRSPAVAPPRHLCTLGAREGRARTRARRVSRSRARRRPRGVAPALTFRCLLDLAGAAAGPPLGDLGGPWGRGRR